MSDTIDLAFLAKRIERLTEKVNSLSDDMQVMMAILQRLDGSHSGLVNEIRATHSRQSRMEKRLTTLEEQA